MVTRSRQWALFEMFLHDVKLLAEGTTVQDILDQLPADFPEWICAWIMSK